MSVAVQHIRDTDRRRHVDRRSHAELVLELARHLDEPDRLLIEQVYRHGVSMAELARLTGSPPRLLQRRVARLLRRCRDPLFRFVVSRLELLPREVHATARRAVLEGHSLRATARLTGLSLHHVRQHVKTIHALARVM